MKDGKLKRYGPAPTLLIGLAKMILQGTVLGKRRGRQRKRWEDNICK